MKQKSAVKGKNKSQTEIENQINFKTEVIQEIKLDVKSKGFEMDKDQKAMIEAAGQLSTFDQEEKKFDQKHNSRYE